MAVLHADLNVSHANRSEPLKQTLTILILTFATLEHLCTVDLMAIEAEQHNSSLCGSPFDCRGQTKESENHIHAFGTTVNRLLVHPFGVPREGLEQKQCNAEINPGQSPAVRYNELRCSTRQLPLMLHLAVSKR